MGQVDDVFFTLELPDLHGGIRHIFFGVVRMWDVRLLTGLQCHPHLVDVGGLDVYPNVFKGGLEVVRSVPG